MAATVETIDSTIMRKARSIARPHGGKSRLAEAAGLTRLTLNAMLASGMALPKTASKLEAGLKKLEEKQTA